MTAMARSSTLEGENLRIDFMSSSPFLGCREHTHRRLRRIASLAVFVGRRGQGLQDGTTGVKSELHCSRPSPCNRFIARVWTVLLCHPRPAVVQLKKLITTIHVGSDALVRAGQRERPSFTELRSAGG